MSYFKGFRGFYEDNFKDLLQIFLRLSGVLNLYLSKNISQERRCHNRGFFEELFRGSLKNKSKNIVVCGLFKEIYFNDIRTCQRPFFKDIHGLYEDNF